MHANVNAYMYTVYVVGNDIWRQTRQQEDDGLILLSCIVFREQMQIEENERIKRKEFTIVRN